MTISFMPSLWFLTDFFNQIMDILYKYLYYFFSIWTGMLRKIVSRLYPKRTRRSNPLPMQYYDLGSVFMR